MAVQLQLIVAAEIVQELKVVIITIIIVVLVKVVQGIIIAAIKGLAVERDVAGLKQTKPPANAVARKNYNLWIPFC